MSQLTATSIVNQLTSLLSSLDATDATLVKALLLRRAHSIPVTDGGTAGTAQGETVLWRNNTGASVKVVSAHASAPVAVTAHGTNYATFTVTKRTSAGASAATVATFATDTVTTDDMTAFAPVALTLTDANVVVPDGYVLTGKVTKAASGVAVASATAQALISVVVEPV
jgi:hypothetical protein